MSTCLSVSKHLSIRQRFHSWTWQLYLISFNVLFWCNMSHLPHRESNKLSKEKGKTTPGIPTCEDGLCGRPVPLPPVSPRSVRRSQLLQPGCKPRCLSGKSVKFSVSVIGSLCLSPPLIPGRSSIRLSGFMSVTVRNNPTHRQSKEATGPKSPK